MAEPLFDDKFLKRLEYLFVVSKKIFAGRLRAKRKTKIVGSGLEFADYREYSPGDDLRYLDWNLLARTDRMLIRLFEEEEDLFIYFLVDCSRSMQVGTGRKAVYAKRLAAALSYIGLSNMDRVSVVPFADKLLGRLPPARGKAQIFKVLRFLEQDFKGSGTDLKSAFRKFSSQNKRRGLVVLISDFYDVQGAQEAINFLRFQRFEPLVCHVYDEADLEPDMRGDLELVDCETGDRVQVTVTPDLLKRYRQAHEALMDEVATFCTQKQVLYFRAPVQIPFDELVLKVFRAGGFLR
ncbi:MAG: DUF58 domain-containing protein [Myxococcales bacterium]|nr:DUF58 domain-containing protein [Myxococcales bacterium]